jgi:hypothetical protein
VADNTQLNSGSGGDIISTDAITTLNGGAIATGEKAQRVKIGWGVDGTFNDANATNPLPVNPPTLTKFTQGSVGVSTQDLKDSGRNNRIFMLDTGVAAPATEAVQSVVQWYSNAAVAGTTQPAVIPAGKKLRLTSWSISYRSLATVGSAVLRIRANTAGLGVIGSPLAWSCEAGSVAGATTTAMTGALSTVTGVFPEGFEFDAATGLAFTLQGLGPTGTGTLEGVTRFVVQGYEY